MALYRAGGIIALSGLAVNLVFVFKLWVKQMGALQKLRSAAEREERDKASAQVLAHGVTTAGSLRVEEPSGDSVGPTRSTAALQNANCNYLGLLPERCLPPF